MALLNEKVASGLTPWSDFVIGGVEKLRSRETERDGDGKREVTAGIADVRRQSSSETYLGTS